MIAETHQLGDGFYIFLEASTLSVKFSGESGFEGMLSLAKHDILLVDGLWLYQKVRLADTSISNTLERIDSGARVPADTSAEYPNRAGM